jgi:hypothetical protein
MHDNNLENWKQLLVINEAAASECQAAAAVGWWREEEASEC